MENLARHVALLMEIVVMKRGRRQAALVIPDMLLAQMGLLAKFSNVSDYLYCGCYNNIHFLLYAPCIRRVITK